MKFFMYSILIAVKYLGAYSEPFLFWRSLDLEPLLLLGCTTEIRTPNIRA